MPAQVPPGPTGVTVIVADIGAAVALVAVKLGILPVPAAANPIAGLLLVQLNTVPAITPVNVTGAVEAPLHTVWPATPFTFAVGFTVIVKLTGVPVQLIPPLVNVGVTVIVDVTGAAVLLIAVKDGILPTPSGPCPICAPVCVQLYTIVPPVVGLVKFTAVVAVLLHTTWLATALTIGVGFTVIVKLTLGPGQPLAIGVTVTSAVTGALVILVAMKLGISPLPAGARPIDIVLLVQLKIVPNTGPVKWIRFVAAPLHSTWLAGTGLTIGVGYTVTVAKKAGPGQLFAVGIIV